MRSANANHCVTQPPTGFTYIIIAELKVISSISIGGGGQLTSVVWTREELKFQAVVDAIHEIQLAKKYCCVAIIFDFEHS